MLRASYPALLCYIFVYAILYQLIETAIMKLLYKLNYYMINIIIK